MREQELVDDIVLVLADAGFGTEIESPWGAGDGRVVLFRNSVRRAMRMAIVRHLTLSGADAERFTVEEDLLFVTEYVNPRTADALRRRGVCFCDLAGNVYIATSEWLVDVRGRKPDNRPRQASYTSENLYSPRRAQVLFALLTWPEMADAPLREVARCAGVSLGLAQSTISTLAHDWDLHPLRDRQRLIDGWVAAFPYSLASSLTIRSFASDQVSRLEGALEVSGEAAAGSQLNPARAIVYVRELTGELILSNRWRTDGPANVVVRRKFWTEPFEPEGRQDGPRDAPPLLVYADLAASDDPRVRSAAELFRAQV